MKRFTPDARTIDILEAALVVAICGNYRTMTRAQVADQAGVSAPLVTHYFKDMDALRVELMIYAVEKGEAEVVAQGLLDKNEHALRASDELKAKAKATISW